MRADRQIVRLFIGFFPTISSLFPLQSLKSQRKMISIIKFITELNKQAFAKRFLKSDSWQFMPAKINLGSWRSRKFVPVKIPTNKVYNVALLCVYLVFLDIRFHNMYLFTSFFSLVHEIYYEGMILLFYCF